MFNKDTFRLINKTKNRFICILLIVFIGVTFMMGLLVTPTVMRTSMDAYADITNLHDVQIYSSYGFDDEDIEVISNIECVQEIFASKFFDCYCLDNRNKITAISRVEELQRNIDQFEIIEGRYPKNDTECLVLNNTLTESNYKLGDTLKIFYDDEEINKKTSITEYTIVGFVRSPAYSAKVLGPSTYKNLDLELVIYAPKDNFIADYYSTVYIIFDNTKSTLSYTEQYSSIMEENLEEIEYYCLNQQDKLKNKLIDNSREEIQINQEKLSEIKNENQLKLDDAKEQLEEARISLVVMQTALSAINTPIANELSELNNKRLLLSSEYNEAKNRSKTLENENEKSFDLLSFEVLTNYAIYQIANEFTEENPKIIQKINELNNNIEERRNTVLDLYNTVFEIEEEIDNLNPLHINYFSNFNQLTKQLIDTKEEIRINELYISSMSSSIELLELLQNDYSIENARNIKKYINSLYNKPILEIYNEVVNLNNTLYTYDGKNTLINSEIYGISIIDDKLNEFQKQLDELQNQYLEGLNTYNESLYTLNTEMASAQKQIDDAYEQLEELPTASWTILNRDEHYSSALFASNADQMGAIGVAIPLLFYLVAALVCMTTMSRLIDEQRGQIGIFVALGFSKKKIISKYALYGFIACFIGSILGIAIGPITFPVIVYNTWRLMYVLPDIQICYPIWVMAICAIAFTLLVVIETTIIVSNTLKEKPASLLRPKAPRSTKKIILEKVDFIWNRLKFVSKITARNIFRYKSRFFMTIIGIAGCTSLLVLGWGVKDSIADIIDIQFGEIFNSEYNIRLENDSQIEEIEISLNNSNIAYVSLMNYTTKVYLDNEDKTAYVEVIDSKEYKSILNIYEVDGKTPLKLKNNGVIVSRKFAYDNDIKIGDYILIESYNGSIHQVKVSGICEMYFQHYIFISENYYKQVFNEDIIKTNIAVKETDYDCLANCLESFNTVEAITDFSKMIEQFNIMIEALDYIILIIIITAGSLAFVVLFNLIQVNISERSREIATLKVLGFHNKEVYSYIFKEIFILSLIGSIIGLPLGVLEHYYVMNIIQMDMVYFGSNINLLSYIYAFAITLCFTFISLILTKPSLRRIKMVESLKSVE